MLSVAVWHSTWKDIFTGHIQFEQAPPLGFICVVRMLASVLGDSELVLRLVPFIFSLALLPLAYAFARHNFDEKFATVFLFFITASDPLLYYAVQFKQYSAEAFFALAFLYAYTASRLQILETGKIPWKLFLLAFVGTQFGNTAFFVLAGILIAMVLETRKNLSLFFKSNFIGFFLFAVYAALYYFGWASQLESVKSGFMDKFWALYYLPKSVYQLLPFLRVYGIPLLNYFVSWTPFGWLNAFLFLGLFVLGLVLLGRKRRPVFVPVVCVFGLALLLYLLRQYPFGALAIGTMKLIGFRMVLYLLPIAFIPLALSISSVMNLKIKFMVPVWTILMLALALQQNYERLEAGSSVPQFWDKLSLVFEHTTPRTAFVLNTYAEPSFLYYANRANALPSKEYLLPDIGSPHPFEQFSRAGLERIKLPENIQVGHLLAGLKEAGYDQAYLIFFNLGAQFAYTRNAFTWLSENWASKTRSVGKLETTGISTDVVLVELD
jgi:hypothetical protein